MSRNQDDLESQQEVIMTGWVEIFTSECGKEVFLWKEHRVNGLTHKEDGPAVIYYNGQQEWYLNGNKVSPMEIFDNLTPEQKAEAIWHLDEWK